MPGCPCMGSYGKGGRIGAAWGWGAGCPWGWEGWGPWGRGTAPWCRKGRLGGGYWLGSRGGEGLLVKPGGPVTVAGEAAGPGAALVLSAPVSARGLLGSSCCCCCLCGCSSSAVAAAGSARGPDEGGDGSSPMLRRMSSSVSITGLAVGPALGVGGGEDAGAATWASPGSAATSAGGEGCGSGGGGLGAGASGAGGGGGMGAAAPCRSAGASRAPRRARRSASDNAWAGTKRFCCCG